MRRLLARHAVKLAARNLALADRALAVLDQIVARIAVVIDASEKLDWARRQRAICEEPVRQQEACAVVDAGADAKGG